MTKYLAKCLLLILFIVLFTNKLANSAFAASCLNTDVSFPPIENFSAENIEIGCKGGQDANPPVPGADCKGSKRTISPGSEASLEGCDCLFAKKYYLENVPDNCDLSVSEASSGQNGFTSTAVITGSCRELPKPSVSKAPVATPVQVCPQEGRCEYDEVCYSGGKEGKRTCHGLKEGNGACHFSESCAANCGSCRINSGTPGGSGNPGPGGGNPGGSSNPGEGGENPGGENPDSSTSPDDTALPEDTPPSSQKPNQTPKSSDILKTLPTPFNPNKSANPTPDYNPAMCKCDGIESTALLPGQLATFTVYGKVTGEDLSKAFIDNFTFYMGKSTGDSLDVSILSKSEPIKAVIVSSGKDKIRYKATWRQTLPNLIDGNTTYRVWTQIKCDRKKLASAIGGTNGSSFNKVLGLFDNIFNSNKVVNTPSPTISGNIFVAPGAKDTIQLKRLKPAQIEKNACSTILFKFTE